MATAKTKKSAVKKKAIKRASVPTKKILPQPKIPVIPVLPVAKKSLYIHYAAFVPYCVTAPDGYVDYYQQGRKSNNGSLIAPILLPVGSIISQVVIYYKNNTTENMMALVLKHHVEHVAASGEIEVAFITCPPGTSVPDNFLSSSTTLTTTGKILDKYMYHIEIDSTIKNATEERVLLGAKIVYSN
ncbi:MAG: hypothetical protein QM802_04240 [Agriterribacter sp.]